MIKHITNYFAIPLSIIVFTFIGLNTNQNIEYVADPADYSTEGLELHYTVSEAIALSEDSNDETFKFSYPNEDFPLYLGKTYLGFKEAIGFKESRGNYFSVNSLGYLGKYQFGAETLKLIGIYNPNGFLYNPELQEKAFMANASRNKWVLRNDIKSYVGTKIGNITITESGILAAAHLAGPGNVKRFLRTNGRYDMSDAYGTTMKKYMKRFSGYDTTFIKPNKKAKAVI